ncbi:uncharacterized protein ACIBXB_010395 [Morphnus guianensis]
MSCSWPEHANFNGRVKRRHQQAHPGDALGSLPHLAALSALLHPDASAVVVWASRVEVLCYGGVAPVLALCFVFNLGDLQPAWAESKKHRRQQSSPPGLALQASPACMAMGAQQG